MSVTQEAAIAANRFGLGARPGELKIASSDPRGWLRQQVVGTHHLPDAIRALPASSSEFTTYRVEREKRRQRERAEAAGGNRASRPPEPRGRGAQEMYQDQVAARYRVAVGSAGSFRERLVHFWTNHFAVSSDKAQVRPIVGTLENEAIRPNLDGSFTDLLFAVEAHPAMILYLDNQASVGPNSQFVQREGQRRGNSQRKLDINENLAREILELHTLGVDGGYTQADVTSFARVLTGWSVGDTRGPFSGGEPGKFIFREQAHEPGAQTVLGKRYAEGGIEQPRAVLRDLARHPSTATFIATKLVRHFVADEPPPAAVERIAKVFRDTQGNLPKIHAALIDLPEAWAKEPLKFRTPHEFVVAAYRMFDFIPARPQQILEPFQLLAQRPYTPGSPAGWPDVASLWDGPDALLNRIEWASQLSQRVDKVYAPLELADASLGAALSARTRQAVARAESATQGITLLLASPDFQRR